MAAEQRIADNERPRRKRAELAGRVGAGALGMGVGVLLANYLRGAGTLLIVAGAGLHASGMWNKHRLERSAGEEALWWETVLYRSCWAMLGGLFVYVALHRSAYR